MNDKPKVLIKVIKSEFSKSGLTPGKDLKPDRPWKLYKIGFLLNGVPENGKCFKELDPGMEYSCYLDEETYMGKDGKPHTSLTIANPAEQPKTAELPAVTSTPPDVKQSTEPIHILPDLKAEFQAHKVELAKAVSEITWFVGFLSRME